MNSRTAAATAAAKRVAHRTKQNKKIKQTIILNKQN